MQKINYGFSDNIGIDDVGFVEFEGQRCYEVALDIEQMHLNGSGILHGGVITTLLDCAMARVFFLDLRETPRAGVTLEMKTNFLKAVKSGRVRALGFMVKGGNTTCYTEATIVDEGQRVIARGSATMMVMDQKLDTRKQLSE
jgi:uncharacterized protein (TIGR00369 family)